MGFEEFCLQAPERQESSEHSPYIFLLFFQMKVKRELDVAQLELAN